MSDIQKQQSNLDFSLFIANCAVKQILIAFDQMLQVNRLVNYIPQFNTRMVDQLNQQCVDYFHLEPEFIQKQAKMRQQSMPQTAVIDSIINFHIKIENQQQIKQQGSKQANIRSQSSSLVYSLQKSSILVANSKQPPPQLSLQLVSCQKFSQNPLIPLAIKKQTIDQQIQKVKHKMYMMRRFRKKNIQDQRTRLEEHNKKRNHSLFFNKDKEHSYSYEGNLQQVKKTSKQLNVATAIHAKQLVKPVINSKRLSLLKSSAFSQDTSIFIQQNEKQQNPQRNISSNQIRKNSYNNGNNRQTSHLPYIKLKQNTKLLQKKKQSSGSNSLRESLSHSYQSPISQVGFKSFAKLQQQRRLQQTYPIKAIQYTQSTNQFIDIQLLTPTLHQNGSRLGQNGSRLGQNGSSLQLKQSRMMQKYLDKLQEPRRKVELILKKERVSSNFQKIKMPNRYPIQKFYQYDYDYDKNQFATQYLNASAIHQSNHHTSIDKTSINDKALSINENALSINEKALSINDQVLQKNDKTFLINDKDKVLSINDKVSLIHKSNILSVLNE